MRVVYLVLLLALLMSACLKENKHLVSSDVKCDSVGMYCYFVKDTISTLYISHHECTECLDASLDSGRLYVSEDVHMKLVDIYNERGSNFLPNGRDLRLVGEEKIGEKLFGNSENFMEFWHNKYLVKGKAIDISKGDGGIVFRVDSYKKL